MKRIELKYGLQSQPETFRIYMTEGELPIEVLNGRPGYINFLDAFNSWQLVKELKAVTGLPAAASFGARQPCWCCCGPAIERYPQKDLFCR